MLPVLLITGKNTTLKLFNKKPADMDCERVDKREQNARRIDIKRPK